ncbi:MAG: 23S rRNA (adenine(2503)-C(2))-methyltransferase RlmN [Melioribacteraceae bacterium]|nr:23S rRNA (adenine(2503)-C(2))-methyltransferase RlmN [Melioribacteraceae bacterium]
MKNDLSKKTELKNLTLSEIEDHLVELGSQKFRGKQVFNWMYNNLATSFDEMQNLPKELRADLDEKYSLKTLEVLEVQNSAESNTRKFLFETSDKRKIESVIIPDKDRNTLCLSTQVGCPLDCKFCATGVLGFKRNLTVGEIIDQYMLVSKEFGKEYITNLVYMGMGEPLINFKGTIGSLNIFTSEFNKSLSRTRITVSTSGIPGKIKELADNNFRVKLALSLHSPFEDIRSKIMPINRKYSLKDTLDAVHYYSRVTKTRITFEYTMLKGINDRQEDLEALTKISRALPSKVNIIPFNSIAHMVPTGLSAELEPTSSADIEKFADGLRDNNITVMVRDTQGSDIAAACGQLAAKTENNLEQN